MCGCFFGISLRPPRKRTLCFYPDQDIKFPRFELEQAGPRVKRKGIFLREVEASSRYLPPGREFL